MAHQFKIATEVTFIDETQLTFNAIVGLGLGKIPTRNSVKDQNIVNSSPILILRLSNKFKQEWRGSKDIPPVVLKSKY